MAITTLSGILSGLQQPVSFAKGTISSAPSSTFTKFITYWASTGFPKAGALDTTLNGVTLSGGPAYSNNIVGQIPYRDPASGNGYVAKISIAKLPVESGQTPIQSNQGQYILCDRLWHNGGIDGTITTVQSITSPTWPARDALGGTNGEGCLIGLEINNPNANFNLASITIIYTNSLGVGSRTALAQQTGINAQPGQQYDIYLQAGDTGVQSIQSIQYGAFSVSGGTCNLVVYRPVAIVSVKSGTWGTTVDDAIHLGFPRIFNGSVLYWLFRGNYAGSLNASAPQITGTITFAQG